MTTLTQTQLDVETTSAELFSMEHDLRLSQTHLKTAAHGAETLMNMEEMALTLESMNPRDQRGLAFAAKELLGEDVLSLESLQDTMDKAWKAVMKFMKEMVDKLTSFFSKVFAGVKRLDKNAMAVDQTLSALQSAAKSPKQTAFKFTDIEMIAIDNRPSGRTLLQGTKNVNRVINEAREAYIATSTSISKSVSQFTNSSRDALRLQGRDDAEMRTRLSAAAIGLESEMAKALGRPIDSLAKHGTTRLPGNKYLKVKSVSMFDKDIKDVVLTDGDFEYTGNKVVETPELRDLIAVVAEIRRGNEAIARTQRDKEQMLDAYKRSMTDHDDLINAIPDDDESKLKKTAMKQLTRLIYWSIRKNLVGKVNQLTSYQFRVLRKSLAFVNEATKAYE